MKITCHLTGCGKKTQIMQKFSGENAEKCVNYAEISTVNKIDTVCNKAFPMYQATVKQQALQSLAHNLCS